MLILKEECSQNLDAIYQGGERLISVCVFYGYHKTKYLCPRCARPSGICVLVLACFLFVGTVAISAPQGVRCTAQPPYFDRGVELVAHRALCDKSTNSVLIPIVVSAVVYEWLVLIAAQVNLNCFRVLSSNV